MKAAAKQTSKIWPIALSSGLVIAMIILLYVFIFKPPSANAADYPIQGFDVSHHQKDIQWKKISPQKYRFVYLKSTEGGDFKDTKFQENWLKAREQGLLVGAYHFYRLCRDSQVQANNFIESVPNKPDALPPVIDLEYDSHCINNYSKEQLLKEIQVIHDALKKHYGKQPIFYTSKTFYNIVLAGSFQDVPLWIREYKGLPNLKDQPKWHFWQHTSQGHISGINTPVDLNVFYGSEQDWIKFLTENGLSDLPKHMPIK